jgi:hypothetical protein
MFWLTCVAIFREYTKRSSSVEQITLLKRMLTAHLKLKLKCVHAKQTTMLKIIGDGNIFSIFFRIQASLFLYQLKSFLYAAANLHMH